MKKTKIIALIVIVVAIIGIILVVFLMGRPYIQVSQIKKNPSKYYEREIQVIGIIEGFSGRNFNLTEGNDFILVDTADLSILPSLSNGIEVVVEGIFNSSMILKASKILTECS